MAAPASPAPAAQPMAAVQHAPPANPCCALPPPAGRGAGLPPGLLNAPALRGPGAPMASTTTASSTLPATQPLAYVPPEPPPPVPQMPTPKLPLQDAGTLNAVQPPPT